MSQLPIIHDTTKADRLIAPKGVKFGLKMGDRPREGRAYGNLAEPLPSSLIIPRSEWQARIKEREERRSGLYHLIEDEGVDCKDQAQTNYCWMNSPVWCMEAIRAKQNERRVVLSPASAAAQLKNYRNVGGWGKEALEFIVKYGIAPVDLWPANAIQKSYAKPETKQAMLDFRCDEWWELDPRNHDQLISVILHNFPVACGFNWWGHETSAYDVVWRDGEACPVHMNSWGKSYGDKGRFVLQGSRALADDAVVPRTARAA